MVKFVRGGDCFCYGIVLGSVSLSSNFFDGD